MTFKPVLLVHAHPTNLPAQLTFLHVVEHAEDDFVIDGGLFKFSPFNVPFIIRHSYCFRNLIKYKLMKMIYVFLILSYEVYSTVK
jgi:hypothetical protein